ncbi:Xylulose kinase, putative, partial [Perkinsus marinus ATCC 50983]
MDSPLFLGFDVSTQSCKAVVVDGNLNTVFSTSLNFDKDLPQYHTINGVSIKDSSGVAKSPSAMFSSALQLSIERLRRAGCPLKRIVCISGSGQQHGSVYLAATAINGLLPDDDDTDDDEDLGEWQLEHGLFAMKDGPIWMDTSTSEECRQLAHCVGGDDNLAKLTGSKAWESFCAGVLLGRPTRVDYSDAAGMNMMELSSLNWSRPICDFIDGKSADALTTRLGGQPADPMAIAGSISTYWQHRYGFSPSCTVNYWSGDNPCAAAGMGLLNSGDILVSLGTSDTCLCVLPSMPVSPPPSAFIFPHPVKPGSFIAMLVYTNGDVTRRTVKGN